MLSKKMVKVVSVVVAETMPTDPAIKKGDKIFVTVKDTKNQKVNVLDPIN